VAAASDFICMRSESILSRVPGADSLAHTTGHSSCKSARVEKSRAVVCFSCPFPSMFFDILLHDVVVPVTDRLAAMVRIFSSHMHACPNISTHTVLQQLIDEVCKRKTRDARIPHYCERHENNLKKNPSGWWSAMASSSSQDVPAAARK